MRNGRRNESSLGRFDEIRGVIGLTSGADTGHDIQAGILANIPLRLFPEAPIISDFLPKQQMGRMPYNSMRSARVRLRSALLFSSWSRCEVILRISFRFSFRSLIIVKQVIKIRKAKQKIVIPQGAGLWCSASTSVAALVEGEKNFNATPQRNSTKNALNRATTFFGEKRALT